MVDKIIRIGIDSSLAERGAKRVKEALKDVQREAEQTSGAEIDITVDTSGVTEGIAEVNNALRDIEGTSAKIPVGFDADTINRETSDLINRIKAEVERNIGEGLSLQASLDIVADAAVEEIGAMLAGIPDEIGIPVEVFTETVMAEINRLMAEVERSVEVGIPVHLDTTSAKTDARELENATENILPDRIEIDADTSKAEAAISRLTGQAYGPITVSVVADTTRADEQLNGFLSAARDAIKISLSVDTDTAATAIGDSLQQSPDPIVIPVQIDDRAVEEELRRILRQSRGAVELSVTANTDSANAAIGGLSGSAVPPIDVPISVDAGQARAEIDSVSRIDPSSIDIPVRAEDTGANAELQRISRQPRDPIDLSVTVDEAEAERELRAILGRRREPVELPLTVNTDRANSAIDSFSGRAVNPIEFSVSVSSDQLRREIDGVSQIAPDAIEFPVRVSAAGVDAELQSVSRQRRDPIELAVTADEAEAEREVREFIRLRRDGIEVPVAANTDRANAAIDRLSGQTRSPVNVPITVDSDQAHTEIDSVFERSPAPVKIPVTVDAARANEEIDNFFRQTHDPIDVRIAVDADQARAEIDAVSRLTPDAVEIPINVDTSRASAELGRLRDELGKVFPRGGGAARIAVEADVEDVVKGAKRAADALDDVSDAAGDIPKKADQAADSLNAIQAAAARAGAAADNMSDAFKDATREMEAMELIGEALLAISTSIIEAITSFEDFGDAVQAATGHAEAAEMAMAMLEEFAHNTAISLEDATLAFVEFRTNGLEASRAAMDSYGNVAAGLNLTMEELAQAVGDAAQRNFSKLNETQLKAKESGDKVIFTYHGVTTEVKNTSAAIAGFIKQMGNTEFAGALKSQADGVNGAFEAMAEAWHELSRDMGEGGLSRGLEDFSHSMAAASKASDELGRLLGEWLGDQARLLGRDIEGIVDQLNDLIHVMDLLSTKIEGMPSMSSILGIEKGGTIGDTLDSIANSDFMKRAVPAIFDQPTTPDAPEQGPPENAAKVEARAFGSDTESPKKKKRTGKSQAQKQQESFEKQSFANDKMIRTLGVMDEAFERGRGAVVGMRNEIEDTADRTQLLTQVGEKYTDIIMDQKAQMKGLKESIAFKGELLDQQEAIDQTVALAEAHKDGSVAVMQAQAANEAYNAAVRLGVVETPEAVQQLTDLALAAETANRFLTLETDLAGMDQQIESAARMATAYREGGAAIREATLEEQVHAAAVQAGLEFDEASVQKIRDRMLALRELQEIQRSDERALMANIDMEAATAEIENLRLTGEEYLVASERLDMLTQKKRETKDATATLTPEEERLAAALGHVAYQSALANDALSQLANDGRNAEMMFRDAVAGGLGHFEDALVDIVTGAKSAKEAFADMAKAIAADLARMAIRMAIIQPLAMMFGGGAGMAGGMAGGMMMGGMRHTGGIVGTDAAPPKAFSVIPKFHTGGIVGDKSPLSAAPFASFPKFHTGGLATNETPAVLMKGEGVFTAAQMKALAPVNNNDNSSRGVTVVNNINVSAPPGGDRGAAENQANNIAKMVSMAVDERLTQAQRPGGLLNANGGY